MAGATNDNGKVAKLVPPHRENLTGGTIAYMHMSM